MDIGTLKGKSGIRKREMENVEKDIIVSYFIVRFFCIMFL